MHYLSLILTVAAIHLLAVMSPGPDFVLVTRNSLVYSRRNGILSAFGLGLGILVHVTYCLVGLALIISQSILLFDTIKFFGAAYLIYIGIKSLRAKPSQNTEEGGPHRQPLSDAAALRAGFLTNVSNPKVTLFFLSLFTLVITPTTPFPIKLIMGTEMALATMAWFSLVATVLSHRLVRRRFTKMQHYIERCTGAILIVLGLKLATVSAK